MGASWEGIQQDQEQQQPRQQLGQNRRSISNRGGGGGQGMEQISYTPGPPNYQQSYQDSPNQRAGTYQDHPSDYQNEVYGIVKKASVFFALTKLLLLRPK